MRTLLSQFNQNLLDIWSALISHSYRVPHPLTSPRWCLISLACLQQRILLGQFSQNPSYSWCFLLVIFHLWPPVCSLAVNSHFLMQVLELGPVSFPDCNIPLQWSLYLLMLLDKVCLNISNNIVGIFILISKILTLVTCVWAGPSFQKCFVWLFLYFENGVICQYLNLGAILQKSRLKKNIIFGNNI